MVPALPAVVAINTLLQLGDGASPEVFTTIANVSSIDGLQLSANVVDITSHSTAQPWREKITTLLDAGDLTTTLFFDPKSTQHQLLLTIFQEKTGAQGLRDYRILFPEVGAPKYVFAAYISKFSMKAPVDGVLTADLTFTATDKPNFNAA